MTVCIAAICESGKAMVLAADAMITGEDLMIEYEFAASKLKQLTKNCVVAAAGNANLETDLIRMVRQAISELKAPSRDKVIEKTRQTYRALRERAIEDQILLPKGIESMAKFYDTQKSMLEVVAKAAYKEIEEFDLELDLIIASVDSDGVHITVVEDPGVATTWDDLSYHAIGSGYTHADTTLIIQDYDASCSLPEALLSVYTAKKAAEKAPGVGRKITHMAVIHKDGVIMLADEQVKKIDEVYQERTAALKNWERDKNWTSKLVGVVTLKPTD